MDKKIYESDKNKIITLNVDRSLGFRETIAEFANNAGIAELEGGGIDYSDKSNRCLMLSVQLRNGIEMGYFDFKFDRNVRIINTATPGKEMIALTFNFGTPLENEGPKKEYFTSQGIANSIYINNFKITTRVKIDKNLPVHMLVIRYPVSVLKEHFFMAKAFLTEVVRNDGPVIVYADYHEGILQTLRTMELPKIPVLTREPFLFGKALELMALFVEILENRNSRRSFNFNADEFDRLIRAKNFIVSNWKKPPTIRQVSDFLGMSPTKAKGLFRQTFGKPIYTYFKEKRMAEALRLIHEGEWTIAEIGHYLGYKNLGHFAESFYKQYGILPKKLSKSIKSGTPMSSNKKHSEGKKN